FRCPTACSGPADDVAPTIGRAPLNLRLGGRAAFSLLVTMPTKDGLMISKPRLHAAFAAALMASACATTSPLVRQQCDNADAQLASVLQPFEALRAKGCVDDGGRHGGSECDRLRREIERLSLVCPAHAPTLMANAVIAYDAHQPDVSQQLLDQI